MTNSEKAREEKRRGNKFSINGYPTNRGFDSPHQTTASYKYDLISLRKPAAAAGYIASEETHHNNSVKRENRPRLRVDPVTATVSLFALLIQLKR